STTAFRLTEQLKKILSLLHRYTNLRTSHMYTVLAAESEGGKRAVRRMLHDFWQHGYLEREPMIDYSSHAAPLRYEYVYWLSRTGVKATQEIGLDRNVVWTSAKSPHSLDHEASITDFHLAVESFATTNHFDLYWQ